MNKWNRLIKNQIDVFVQAIARVRYILKRFADFRNFRIATEMHAKSLAFSPSTILSIGHWVLHRKCGVFVICFFAAIDCDGGNKTTVSFHPAPTVSLRQTFNATIPRNEFPYKLK